MKSGDKPELDWPHLDGEWESEEAGHVQMKNTAVYFLLSQGFEAENITEELSYERWSIDVAVVMDDGTIVGVECETDPASDLASDAPSRDGHKIFLLTERGLYEPYGPSSSFLQPVDIQLKLYGGNGKRTGRWFADGRKPEQIPEEAFFDAGYQDDRVARAYDGYDRWKATGEPKQQEQPSLMEIFPDSSQ